jgi:hypothetical protein
MNLQCKECLGDAYVMCDVRRDAYPAGRAPFNSLRCCNHEWSMWVEVKLPLANGSLLVNAYMAGKNGQGKANLANLAVC